MFIILSLFQCGLPYFDDVQFIYIIIVTFYIRVEWHTFTSMGLSGPTRYYPENSQHFSTYLG